MLHPVSDLAAAKPVYTALLGVPPEADAPYYVGYDVGGQHIGLVPDGGPQAMTSPVAYWHVADIEAKLAEVTAAGATVKEPARRRWRPPGGHRDRPRRQRARHAPGPVSTARRWATDLRAGSSRHLPYRAPLPALCPSAAGVVRFASPTSVTRDPPTPTTSISSVVRSTRPMSSGVLGALTRFKLPALRKAGFQLSTDLTVVLLSRSGYSAALREKAEHDPKLILVNVPAELGRARVRPAVPRR